MIRVLYPSIAAIQNKSSGVTRIKGGPKLETPVLSMCGGSLKIIEVQKQFQCLDLVKGFSGTKKSLISLSVHRSLRILTTPSVERTLAKTSRRKRCGKSVDRLRSEAGFTSYAQCSTNSLRRGQLGSVVFSKIYSSGTWGIEFVLTFKFSICWMT